jgi:hypothetical protein
MIVDKCTKVIEKHGLKLIGIYRVSGRAAEVSLLMEDLNKVRNGVDIGNGF